MSLSPAILTQINLLAEELVNRFESPQYYPGCEVVSVADVDQYAAGNGWIECLVAQHNQQRCRWKNQYAAVAVGDFVDVLYFPGYRLFTVDSQGGAGALKALIGAASETAQGIIELATQTEVNTGTDAVRAVTPATLAGWAGAGGWPFADVLTVDASDPDAAYTTIAAAAGAVGVGGTILFAGVVEMDSPLLLEIPGATLMGFGITSSLEISDTDSGLELDGGCTLQDFSISLANSGASPVALSNIYAGTYALHRLQVTAQSASPYDATAGYFAYGTTRLYQCSLNASGGLTNYALIASGSGVVVEVFGGELNANISALNNATIRLFGPRVTGSLAEASGGTIEGWYVDGANEVIFIGGGGGQPVELYRPDLSETDARISSLGDLEVDGSVLAAGRVEATDFESSMPTGTPPLTVASTTRVPNLNADYLDGYHGADLVAKTSASRPGVTRLYRGDHDSNYNVQVHSDGARWWLRGYNIDTFHAECRVGYADLADTLTGAKQCLAYRSANYGGVRNAWTPVALDVSTSTSTGGPYLSGGYIYVTRTGYYIVTGTLEITNGNAISDNFVAIGVNGNVYGPPWGPMGAHWGRGANLQSRIFTVWVGAMNAGQYVGLYYYNQPQAAVNPTVNLYSSLNVVDLRS